MTSLVRVAEILGHPGADTVAIESGRISWIGRGASTARTADVHLPDGVLLPGLRDAHIHPVGLAASVTGADLAEARDLAEIAEMIRNHARHLPAGRPVIATGLDEERLAEGRLPVRTDLDEIDRPVVAIRRCGHVAVANTAALNRAALGAGTVDPPGGSLDRDDHAHPTGVLRETAIFLVTGPLAADSPSPTGEQLLAAVHRIAGRGVTAVDAILSTGGAMWCGTASELDDLLAVAPRLPIRVRILVAADTVVALDDAVDRIGDAGGLVEWKGWKGFADGSLGGHTAALDAPYHDRPESAGIVRLDPARHAPLARRALDLGGVVAVHAIGDRGNRAALDLLTGLGRRSGTDGRLRVEHASLLPPDLVDRFARHGIAASVQPAFAGSDAGWIVDRLGRERTGWAYPFAAMRDAGIQLLGGSDAPVEDPDPWPAIATAASHPLGEDRSLAAGDALALYAPDPVAVGRPADIVVVDRNPLTASDVGATEVLAVWVDGHPVRGISG